jgi:NADPH:quinone reductase
MTNLGTMKRFLLARRPAGMPVEEDFQLGEVPVPQPEAGQLLVRAHYISVDPLQRPRMQESSSYGQTIPLGGLVVGRMVGEVIESRNPAYREGEFVEGMLGWQEYALSDGGTHKAEYAPGLTRVDPALGPISTALGILGMPGVTAYFSLLDLGRPQPGETVVISTAAGTVGSLAGQIARIHGCRVVGICGSEEKRRYVVDELGFAGAVNYNATSDLAGEIRRLCPGGVDIYLDHVGGATREAVLTNLQLRARVVLVGYISGVNGARPTVADPAIPLMSRRARMEGFIVYDYEDRADEARQAIAGWLQEGKLSYRETIVDGFEELPRAFISMLNGGNIGKQLVRMAGAR